jgi:hypothetical protein
MQKHKMFVHNGVQCLKHQQVYSKNMIHTIPLKTQAYTVMLSGTLN